VFLQQGRFGAAVGAMQDAVKGYRAVGDRSSEMVGFLYDLADVLAQSGRADESGKLLEEAQTMARDVKNESLHAALLDTEGDVQLYRGDLKAAAVLYDQAALAASRGADREQALISKLDIAVVALAGGRAQSVVRDLRALSQQADNLNMKYLALESSVDVAEALVQDKDYSHALQELQADLGKSERLGTQYQTARIQYLLGDAFRLGGNATEASNHYRQALTLLDNIKKEPGAEHLMDRFDLHTIYAEASRWAAGAKS
jgi:tetratricopeptide (TPR) repeat protein